MHVDLEQVGDVCLDGVEAVPGGTVGLVVSDVAEQRIAGPPCGRQVGGLGHVAVVVDPVGLDPGVVQVERGRGDVALLPRRGDCQAVAAGFVLVERRAGAHTRGTQRA